MNAPTNGGSMSLEYAADFGSLLPWMPQVHFEIGGLPTSFGTSDPAPAEVPGAEFTRAALHLSERLLRQFFDDSPISVAVFDPVGRLVHVNRAFGAMLGFAATELMERNIEELMHPDDVPAIRKHRRLLVEGKCATFHIDTRFAPAYRREVWTRMWGRLERYGGDQPTHIFAHMVEFTALKYMQENLRRAEEESHVNNWEPERYP